MQTRTIGIIGLGTVGSGTLQVLFNNSKEIQRRIGHKLVVKLIAVKNINKKRNVDLNGVRLTENPYDIIDDPEIDIVVELVGGEGTTYEYLLRAVRNGKHIVTANKDLIANRGNELFKLAREASVQIGFEAAVAGGIPVIKAIREGLSANHVHSIIGIVNGTSNFILTGMKNESKSFNEMLDIAQKLGYAEADPAFDIQGIDAAHKITILASIAFGIPMNYERVYHSGIDTIDYDDVLYAEELGFAVKPLAIAKRTDSGIELRVHPCLVPASSIIASVSGVMNAVLINGDLAGETLLYGAGAGDLPTASAVVADIVDIARNMNADPSTRVPHSAFQPDSIADLPITAMGEISTANYLRMHAVNRAGVLAEVTRIFGQYDISIESILQKGTGKFEEVLPVVIVTQTTKEKNMNQALQELEALDTVVGSINRIRIETFS